MVHEGHGAGWTIYIRNFAECREALGDEVLNAFCRCFVHADRLASMISFAHVSEQYYGRDAVAFGRNLNTIVWFTVGTLRELAHAIQHCRAALKKRDLLDLEHGAWQKLRGVEDRWNNDKFFRQMRDKAAFHVDKDVIATGIAELATRADVVLSRGEGPKGDGASMTLALEALHSGLGIDLEEYELRLIRSGGRFSYAA
jgi:hypothetical protein